MDSNTAMVILFGILIVGIFALGAFTLWLDHKKDLAPKKSLADRREEFLTRGFTYETKVTKQPPKEVEQPSKEVDLGNELNQ